MALKTGISTRYYSQAGQDRWVAETFRHRKRGFFLDIGAFDGVNISNTYYLEKLGWDGICVEPNPDIFARLTRNRKVKCMRCAIYSENKMIRFHRAGAGSGISPNGEIKIQAYTLRTLFEICQVPEVIDYISLDVEGMEDEVLKGFPFDTHAVALWTIEHNYAKDNGKLKQRIRDIMLSNGYVVVVDNVYCGIDPFEDWWVNEELVKGQ